MKREEKNENEINIIETYDSDSVVISVTTDKDSLNDQVLDSICCFQQGIFDSHNHCDVIMANESR